MVYIYVRWGALLTMAIGHWIQACPTNMDPSMDHVWVGFSERINNWQVGKSCINLHVVDLTFRSSKDGLNFNEQVSRNFS